MMVLNFSAFDAFWIAQYWFLQSLKKLSWTWEKSFPMSMMSVKKFLLSYLTVGRNEQTDRGREAASSQA
jgi:hypothetical protein